MDIAKFSLSLLLMFLAAGAHADAIDDYVHEQMDRMHIPGVAVAVLRGGKPIKQQGYGYSNLELKTPVTTESVFKVGSVSKQFIASGIVLLAEERKLTLDDKINTFLDAPPAAWDPITIRHLLTHTSGLVRESPGYDGLKIQSEAEVIKKAYGAPLQFRPGEKMVYCNLGYFILAEIISKAAGTPWQTFMEQRIFLPAGMRASRATDMKVLVPDRVNGYVFNKDREYENAAILFGTRPSGAFLSSLADLVRWERALVSGTIVPKAALEQMWQPTTLSDGTSSAYGFGWSLDALSGHPQINHGGSLPGFRAHYMRLPKDDLTVIVLANADGAPTDTLAITIAEQYVPGLFPKRTAVSLTRAQLQPYVGRYDLGIAGIASVALIDDSLAITMGPLQDVKVVPDSTSTFFIPEDRRVQVRFSRLADDQLEMAYFVNERLAISGKKTK